MPLASDIVAPTSLPLQSKSFTATPTWPVSPGSWMPSPFASSQTKPSTTFTVGISPASSENSLAGGKLINCSVSPVWGLGSLSRPGGLNINAGGSTKPMLEQIGMGPAKLYIPLASELAVPTTLPLQSKSFTVTPSWPVSSGSWMPFPFVSSHTKPFTMLVVGISPASSEMSSPGGKLSNWTVIPVSGLGSLSFVSSGPLPGGLNM
mmetsp:Transcript_655/g.1004  ORF Transcript_655/g.1004 Transcript_655/m.1004 type:complete len:206 (+) Transcript_655:1279-1896(+)